MDKYYGELLVQLARKAIESHIKKGEVIIPKNYPSVFDEKSGLFISLHSYPDGKLRGCIGFPEPVFPLIEALKQCAVSVTEDPRFPAALQKGEIDKVTIEVSVLTKPELIVVKDPEEYPEKIDVGKDGLIIEKGHYRGLLLPKVPLQYNWSRKSYLGNLCIKASLDSSQWLDKDVKIYKFGADVFGEEYPKGPVKIIEKKPKIEE